MTEVKNYLQPMSANWYRHVTTRSRPYVCQYSTAVTWNFELDDGRILAVPLQQPVGIFQTQQLQGDNRHVARLLLTYRCSENNKDQPFYCAST